MQTFKSASFVATSLAAFTLSNSPTFANVLDEAVQAPSDNEISITKSSACSGHEQLANRDFHAILSSFEEDTEGGYKFSGCGSAI